MIADRERLLRGTQRRMLRWMLGLFRGRPANHREADTDSSSNSSSTSSSDFPEPEEEGEENDGKTGEETTCVNWIKRATHIAEAHLRRASVCGWVEAQRRRQWRLAGYTSRRTDRSVIVLRWQPPCSNRGLGHPVKRCTTELDVFSHFIWIWEASLQGSGLLRHLLEDGFVRKA